MFWEISSLGLTQFFLLGIVQNNHVLFQVFAQFCYKIIGICFSALLHSVLLNLVKLFWLVTNRPNHFSNLSLWAANPIRTCWLKFSLRSTTLTLLLERCLKRPKWCRRSRIHKKSAPRSLCIKIMKKLLFLGGKVHTAGGGHCLAHSNCVLRALQTHLSLLRFL